MYTLNLVPYQMLDISSRLYTEMPSGTLRRTLCGTYKDLWVISDSVTAFFHHCYVAYGYTAKPPSALRFKHYRKTLSPKETEYVFPN